MKVSHDMDVKFSKKDVKVSIPQKLLGYFVYASAFTLRQDPPNKLQ